MSKVLVSAVESRWDLDLVEFSGCSDLFDAINEGDRAPIYELTLSVVNGVTQLVKVERSRA